MRHINRNARTPSRSIGTAVLVIVALANGSAAAAASDAVGADAPPRCGQHPIDCAAEFIGVPADQLVTDILNRSRETGTIGVQAAIDQLDSALEEQLSIMPVTADLHVVMSHWDLYARHAEIRDSLLDTSVQTLRGVLGG